MAPDRLLEIGTTLGHAIREERPVLITYVAASGERTTRTIEPYEVAATQSGDFVVRAMDRRSGDPRSFRLDRIELIGAGLGGFEVPRPGDTGDDLMPEILVRYHGSRDAHHGVMRLLGICGCVRCASLGVRYRLAEVGSHEAAVWCVRGASITPLDEQDAAEEAALARIRADIALIPAEGYGRDAAHWTPDYAR